VRKKGQQIPEFESSKEKKKKKKKKKKEKKRNDLAPLIEKMKKMSSFELHLFAIQFKKYIFKYEFVVFSKRKKKNGSP